MRQYIGFKLNDNEYTIPILKVREIVNTPAVTGLPQSPPYMKGVINLRGSIIPVLDLRKLISLEGGEGIAPKTVVVSSRGQVFGVLVDEITSVIKIDESNIEPAESFVHGDMERVEGVARLDDRLVIMLDADKLVDLEAMGVFEELLTDALEGGAPARDALAHEGLSAQGLATHESSAHGLATGAASMPLPGAGRKLPAADPHRGEPAQAVAEKDLLEVKDTLSQKYAEDDTRGKFVRMVVDLIECLANHDYERADVMINEMLQASEGTLFNQIGMVTRKLHDSLKEFKNALDPRIKQIADEEVPNAVDSLEYVITRTEEAANRTMEIVERHLKGLTACASHLKKLKGPKESLQHLKEFTDSYHADLTEILLAQEFQDITGQTIRKVIELVNAIEAELVGLITTFGVKPEKHKREAKVSQRVSQDDVDDLLREFGF